MAELIPPPNDGELSSEMNRTSQRAGVYPAVDHLDRARWLRVMNLPSYRTATRHHDDKSDAPGGFWPPSRVVKPDRRKATGVWVVLLLLFACYVVYVALASRDMRRNPPVQIKRKEESFSLPDVVFCPATGDGCDSENAESCSWGLEWKLSAMGGFKDTDEYLATPSPVAAISSGATSSPNSEASSGFVPPFFDDDIGDDDIAARVGPVPVDDDDITSRSFFRPLPTPGPTTPSPVVLPAIRVNVATRAEEWCPRLPLSTYDIDDDGIASGEVRSLHASFYVLWDDEVAEEPVLSTRQFINMFFVDDEVSLADAVVAARLPYDRVNITGTNPFTFLSNDVVLGLSQYVHLGSGGEVGPIERTYTQATTTAQHTIQLKAFEGETYEGALLYVTFNVNKFTYQSIEEVDPVDWWSLVGSAGGMWEIICVVFGVCFVAREASGPDKKWGWTDFTDRPKDGKRRCCSRCSFSPRTVDTPRGSSIAPFGN